MNDKLDRIIDELRLIPSDIELNLQPVDEHGNPQYYSFTVGDVRKLARIALRHALKSGKLAVLVDQEMTLELIGKINDITDRYALRPSYAAELVNEQLRKAGYRPVLIEEVTE